MSEKVTIEHDQWGRVDGVGRNMESCRPLNVMWEKDGACYTEFHGWREVKSKRWVPVMTTQHFNGGDITGISFYVDNVEYTYKLPSGHRLKTVEIEREASADD